jgi:hypothetical protein
MTQHLEPESLSAYLDGELEPREQSEVEQHLRSCRECSATRQKLEMVTGQLAALPPVRVTVDEHRTLRQAVLNARPQAGRRRGMAWLQWSMAGGLALVVVAVLGVSFLRNGGSNDAGEALTEAAAPTAPGFNFTDGSEVEESVAKLPEVTAGLGRYRASDAPQAVPESLKGAAGGRASAMARTDADSPPQQQEAPAPAGEGAPYSGVGSGGGVGQDDLTALPDTESSFTFSNVAADACLARVAATQPYPMVPLLARQASFEGRQAWLLVFAWTAEPDPDAPLDRSQTWLVTPQDCQNLSGTDLESKALYRSFSAPA